MVIFCPMDEMELRDIMFTAQLNLEGPLAIRYPRGRGIHLDWKKPFNSIEIGKGRMIKNGKELAVLSVGPFGEIIKRICSKDKYIDVAHYDMRFVKPLDENLLHEIFSKFSKVITIEDGVVTGGFGMAVLAFKNAGNYTHVKVECLGLPDRFIAHGNISKLYETVGLDQSSVEITIDQVLDIKNG